MDWAIMKTLSTKAAEVVEHQNFYIEKGVKKCKLCGRKIDALDKKACTPASKSALKIISAMAFCFAAIATTVAIMQSQQTSNQKPNEIKPRIETPKISVEKEPCIINPTIHNMQYSGDCSAKQISEGFEKHTALYEENELLINQQSKMAAKEAFDALEKIRLGEKEEHQEFLRKMDDPTAEEREEMQLIIDAEMDRKFKGWGGYRPRIEASKSERTECPIDTKSIEGYKGLTLPQLSIKSDVNPYCKAHAEIVLDLPKESNETEIKKKYRSLALEFHPDKSKEKDAIKIFSMIQTSYETLSLAKAISMM